MNTPLSSAPTLPTHTSSVCKPFFPPAHLAPALPRPAPVPRGRNQVRGTREGANYRFPLPETHTPCTPIVPLLAPPR
ncbi:hypothetical protein LX32DRAFT_645167 [Colletotrichum zoysiae]|uniref:Uncharacterized protein n=1 Tax=Colletotrichum zoysiae TaxID=1216348 RepID=A0AAD9H7H1_9PEZI|nr:hypothetical protein LX32DRAFT_645167 [Colletotrichum zoysiae]